jgi:hypothetical protein
MVLVFFAVIDSVHSEFGALLVDPVLLGDVAVVAVLMHHLV